ncbi:MAG: hypothetical protein WBD78_03940 [Methylocella sp.]
MATSFDWSSLGIAVIGGLLTAGGLYGAGWIKDAWNQPQLRVEIDNRVPFIIDAPGEDSHKPTRRWLRLRVVNNGLTTALKCLVFLTKVQRDGTIAPIFEDDAIPLRASQITQRVYSADIPPKFGRFFDIAVIDKNKSNEMSFDSPEFNSRTAENVTEGTFSLELIVLSDNASAVRYAFKMAHERSSPTIMVSELKKLS